MSGAEKINTKQHLQNLNYFKKSAKLESTLTLQARSDAPRRQHGLTKPYFSNSIENGYSISSPVHKQIDNGALKGVNRINEDRESPSNSSVETKSNASSRWVAPQFLHDIIDHNEVIFRRVRGILNKLTPEKFEKLSYDLINIGIDKTVLKGIIILIYEKAIDEQKYCSLYARLCLKLRNEVPNFDDPTKKSNTFLRMLLSKCQEEFETRAKASSAFDKREGELSPAEQIAKKVAKRKMLGNIKFIGELGKLELLHEAILHKCIQQLLAKKKRTSLSEMAEDIECMCQIMSTTGKRLDTPKAKNIMEQYFERIHKLSASEELPSRIRFLLKDVIELRENKWVPRRIQMENGPRSVTQMRWELMGPMIAPPFPFLPPGMPLPSGMQPPNIPPFGPGNMSWFPNEAFLAGGVMSSIDSKLPEDFHDENKDIFGKPMKKKTPSTTATAPQYIPSIPKPPNKLDLFQPHYMKAKGNNGQDSLTAKNNRKQQQNSSDEEPEKRKYINKSNPWNIDPFAPRFTKTPVNLFNQSEEPKRNELPVTSKSATPPLRYSPPQVPRTSAANSYDKQQQQQQQHQAWKKNKGEVSLRPASMLSKKDDKWKHTLKSNEDLPAKMQQFTNLTINDKTTNKPKKSTLSKADIDKKISDSMKKFNGDNNMTNLCNELQSLATNLKYSKMVAKQLLIFSSSQQEGDWSRIEGVLMECVNKSVFSSESLVKAFAQLLDDIKITESNNGKQFMATIFAMLVVKKLMGFSKLLEFFQDGSKHPAALYVLSNLNERKGKDWLKASLLESKMDLKGIFPKNARSDDQIMKVFQDMEMSFLFPHLCFKDELLQLMMDEKEESTLIQWVNDNGIETISRKLLIHVVVTCAITIATKNTFDSCLDNLAQKPDKIQQEKEKGLLMGMKNLLKITVGGNSCDQLETVYALQVFCFEKEFPKEMLLRLFLYFYDMEVVEEEVFLKWKEDLNDSYPGKGKSLFQVNNWLQWLETADEEEEEEDEDAGD